MEHEHGSSTLLIWMDDTTNKQVLHAEYSEIETTFYEVGDTICKEDIILAQQSWDHNNVMSRERRRFIR